MVGCGEDREYQGGAEGDAGVSADGSGGSNTSAEGDADQGAPILGLVCGDDGECGAGLSCLSASDEEGGSCQEFARLCSTICSDDADCQGLAEDTLCIQDCAGVQRCVAVATDALTVGSVCEEDAQCVSGLSCLSFSSEQTGAGCEEIGRSCSVVCENDADCQALDPRAACLGDCSDAPPSCALLGQ